MKILSNERMQNIEGGIKVPCEGFTAAAAVIFTSLSWGLYFAGPAGWPAAVLAGATGAYLGTQCGSAS